MTLLPNSSGEINSEFSDPESWMGIPLIRIAAILKTIEDINKDKELVESNESISDVFDVRCPGFQLKGEDLSVVKFSSELLQNLDLTFKFKHHVIQTPITYTFDETLSYDDSKRQKLKSIILNKGGYLLEDSNYFEVDNKFLSQGTKLTTLRNSRVSLFWRGLDLNEGNIKRILSFGLCYLLDVISQAELVFYIKKELQNGDYLINISHKKNSYVRIGIEVPVFRY